MDNEVYYYEIGEGRWAGTFRFRITDWESFRAAPLGPRDRLLALTLDLVERMPGRASMEGEILCDPEEGDGVARVEVSVHRFGLEIYRLRGHYALERDGHGVDIHIQHRYGPNGFPWFQKRARAHISDGGRIGRYDMRLVGQPFVGIYEVDDTWRHLAAKYTSDWGECEEVMDRKGAKKPTEPDSRARWSELLDAARELEAHARVFDDQRHPQAPFCHSYSYFVRDLAYQLEDAGFEDPDWVVRLGKAFVQLYLDGVARKRGPEPKAWRKIGDLLAEQRHTSLEELGACMLVHITHDLPHALCRVGLTTPDGRSRVGDYHKVNLLLARAIDPLQDRLSSRYNPIAGLLDAALGRLDEQLASEAIAVGRTIAWYDAQRLADPATREEAERDILARVETTCRTLDGRGISARMTRRALRTGIRLLRRRPRHPAPAQEAFGKTGPKPPLEGEQWVDNLIWTRTQRGHADLDGLQEFLRERAADVMLSERDLGRLGVLLGGRAPDGPPPPASAALTLAAELVDGDDAERAVSRLGLDVQQARAAKGVQAQLIAALREGFDAAQDGLQLGIDTLESVGIPAEAVISALDDASSGHDRDSDIFTARAAAFFPVPLEQVAWIVDPDNWNEVITHVEDSHWLTRHEGRGTVYERVNILTPWIRHHPLVLETELWAHMKTDDDEVRVDYGLERSLDGSFGLDDGFIAARRLDAQRTVVLVEKRLRVTGHALLYGMLRFNPDGLAALLTHWLHDAARRGAARPAPVASTTTAAAQSS